MLFAPLLYKLARLYWFIFRPHTFGTKAVVMHGNKVLLVRQAYLPHLWSFPGGRIKRRESALEAIKREIKEEVNLDIADPKQIGTHLFTHEYKKDHVTFFTVEASAKSFRIDNFEIIEAQWVLSDALPQNIGPVAQEALRLATQKEKPLR